LFDRTGNSKDGFEGTKIHGVLVLKSGWGKLEGAVIKDTPRKFNGWNLKNDGEFPSLESPFPGVDFQVNHVKLQGCTCCQKNATEVIF